MIGLAGIFTAYLFYVRMRNIPERLRKRWAISYDLLREGYYFDRVYKYILVIPYYEMSHLYVLLHAGFHFDRVYEYLWVRPYHRLGDLLWRGLDLGVIDGSIHFLARAYDRGSLFTWKVLDTRAIDGCVDGLAGFVLLCGRSLRLLQTGLIRNYAISMVLGIVLLIGYSLVVKIF
jgi:NADH:ubiquinone oxidoreductase subunit 5 (subunit L)/multisubunit Na+/H+ antiporter MnhA subunit